MNISLIGNIFMLIGSIGLFLYGVDLMGDSLQKVAGEKLSHLLTTLTKNKLSGILLGALITALIQSSTATTVMVVGFVNAGIMTLEAAVPIIMGANIGTTITSWIVSLSSASVYLAVLKPEFIAPLIIGLASFSLVLAKNEKTKLKANAFLGLGLLFLGLSLMTKAMAPYSQSKIFADAMVFLGNNPILGVLTGAVVTFILHSSAASVSILQTLSLGGQITKSACIYITLGQNIGTCFTALLSSVNSSKNAKRAAFVHLFFNVAGAIIFGIGTVIVTMFYPDFMNGSMSIIEISIFHSLFNIGNTIILAPFSKQIVQLSKIIIKGDDDVSTEDTSEIAECKKKLDERLLVSPGAAIATVDEQIILLFEYARESLDMALTSLLDVEKRELANDVLEREKNINGITYLITQYLIKLNNRELLESNRKKVEDMINIASDIERIGDHAENVAGSSLALKKEGVSFSKNGSDDIINTIVCANKCLDATHMYLKTNNYQYVKKVYKYEQQLDDLKDEYKSSHIERLSSGICNIYAGIAFLDTLTNLERITDHCKNIVEYSGIGVG